VAATAQRSEDRSDDGPDLVDLSAFRRCRTRRDGADDGNRDEQWKVDDTLLVRPS
jgi:hypothetical protein